LQLVAVRATCVSFAGQAQAVPMHTRASQPPPGFWHVAPAGAVPVHAPPSAAPPSSPPVVAQLVAVSATWVSPDGHCHVEPWHTSPSHPPPGFWQVAPAGASPQLPPELELLQPAHRKARRGSEQANTKVRFMCQ
jgi:hypothetical protein